MRVQAKIVSQALLAQWDREIAANGYTCELTSFSDIPLPQNENAIPVEAFSRDVLEEQLACLQMGEEIQAFRPLPNHGLKLLVKRVLRKLMKFYIEPITRDITDFHRSCVLAMSQLRNAAVDQRHQAEEQAKRIEDLEQTVAALKAQLQALQQAKEAQK